MRRRKSVLVGLLLLVALSGCTSRPFGSVAPASSTSTTTAASGTAPLTTMLTPPLMPSSGTGAYGYVTAGPTCPVEKQGQPCPPRPFSTAIDAHNERGATVASTQGDSSGRYALDLSPGSYILVVVSYSGWPRFPAASVAVKPGAASRADISCDTGIR
jgi:hypothetical protein